MIGGAETGDADHDWSEPSNLPFARDWAPVPSGREITAAIVIDKRETLSFRVFECESQSSIVLKDLATAHARLFEATRPPGQRLAPIHAQGSPHNAARASPLSGSRPVEEGKVCARTAFGVSVEEMISTHVVLIHRPLNQTHAERLGVEAMVVSNAGRNGSEMVNAGEFHAEVVRLYHPKRWIVRNIRETGSGMQARLCAS